LKLLSTLGTVTGFVERGRNLPQGLPLGPREFGQLRRLTVSLVFAGINFSNQESRYIVTNGKG
jgi:hypothetical protein